MSSQHRGYVALLPGALAGRSRREYGADLEKAYVDVMVSPVVLFDQPYQARQEAPAQVAIRARQRIQEPNAVGPISWSGGKWQDLEQALPCKSGAHSSRGTLDWRIG
jgi:hypothetical protein